MSEPTDGQWQNIVPVKPVKVLKKEDRYLLVAEIKGVFNNPSSVESSYDLSYPTTIFNTESKILLHSNNGVVIPYYLTSKLGWNEGDELFADIFDEELKQIVIGKKLSGEDAIKGLNKISLILK